MKNFGRPNARVHFGPTGKLGTHTKQITRDETGELQLSVSIDAEGRTKIDFGRPVTYLALPPDKAYDFAHLVLEHVKDKQGGEPVNVTEEKIVDALAHAINYFGVDAKFGMADRALAVVMAPEFMKHMAGETDAQLIEKMTPEQRAAIVEQQDRVAATEEEEQAAALYAEDEEQDQACLARAEEEEGPADSA